MTAKRLEIFVIVTIIAVIGIIYAFTQTPVQAPAGDDLQVMVPTPLSFVYPGEDGKNALELLQARYTIETEEYEFGDFVTSINGIKADSNHFWAMYVNEEMSQVGASAYVTKSTDTIKWQLEEIQP